MRHTSDRASIYVAVSLAVALVGPVLVAGIRGTGKYNGVVFYDRWDNCYLFSGIYLMYVSDAVKEALRPYRGESIEIDAKEVYQPMNPGDGLIKKFVFVGRSEIHDHPRSSAHVPPLRGIHLTAVVSKLGASIRATVRIQNAGHAPISVEADALGFAIIHRRRTQSLMCPADGTSCAVITRVDAGSPDGRNQLGEADRTYGWRIRQADRLPKMFTLKPGETRGTAIALELPVGSYEFLAGYGGGVHSGPCVPSNAVAFEVGSN